MSDIREKIRAVLQGPQLAGLATVTDDGAPWVRYVVAFPQDDLSLVIATGTRSRKVAQIRRRPEVHLTCGVSGLDSAQHYVQIEGRAEVTQDDALRCAHWYDQLKAYFAGPADPNYALIIIKPRRIEYMTMSAMQPEVWEA